MIRSVTAVFGLCLFTAGLPVEAQDTLLKYTTNLTFQSDDGQFKVKVGGRMHNHYTWWSADSDFETAGADPEDGVIFRRARLYLAGTIYGNIDFKAQYDFAGGDADFKDLYMEMRDIPRAGAIRVGQFYEPFGLEAQTSSNYISFVERSSGTGPIAPERSTGIMAHDVLDDETLTWCLGAYRLSDSDGDAVGDNAFSFTGRVTYLPWESEDRKNLLHLGFAASIRNPDGDVVSYAADPEARPSEDFLDTGIQAVEKVTLVGLEAATVRGPLSVQAEYMVAQNDGATGAEDFDVSHFYAMVSYFLTGESRQYSRKKAVFSRVKPNENFTGSDGGIGAWEAAIRYSTTDFNDSSITGGEMDQVTLGLNWYLNPNVRVMTNVLLVDTKDIAGNAGIDGKAEAFTMRFQIDF